MFWCESVVRRRPALGGLLASSYRQHQESLAAERERRRLEREERLHRIEREERTRFRFVPFPDLLLGRLDKCFSAIETGPRLNLATYQGHSGKLSLTPVLALRNKYSAQQSRTEVWPIRHSWSCFPNFSGHLILLWSLLSHCEKAGF